MGDRRCLISAGDCHARYIGVSCSVVVFYLHVHHIGSSAGVAIRRIGRAQPCRIPDPIVGPIPTVSDEIAIRVTAPRGIKEYCIPYICAVGSACISDRVLVRAYTRLVATAARRADFVLTDSVASQQDIVRHLGIPAHRVRAIPLAADGRFHPVTDVAQLAAVRQKYRLPDRYLLYLGGFDQRKNVPALLHAFARFLSQQSEARLVVVGKLPDDDSTFFPEPRRIAQALNLGKAVQFTGWVPDEEKPALYAGAEAFVFPSRYEGFGLPPLEAMACGTPVIGSTEASLPEVIGDGGLLVAPDDVDGLARAMVSLWNDADLRATLGERALAHAAGFCWTKAARETLRVYQQAVSGR